VKDEFQYPPADKVTAIIDPPPQYGLTKADKEARIQTLGASEIAAVVGVHPYKNALDVYLSKVGLAPVVEEGAELSDFAEWGHRLEPMIAQKYSDVHGVSLIMGDRVQHPSELWMSATPDRLVLRGWGEKFTDPDVIDRGLELKNRNAHVAHLFGEPGSDIVPMDIAAQCHWSMLVTGLTVWDIAVLIGGNRWSWYRIHRDEEIGGALQQQGYDFWHNHVLPRREPAIDGSESWKQYITQKFAKHTEVLRDGDEDLLHTVASLIRVKEQLKEITTQKDQLENVIKNTIGDAAGIQWPNDVRVTWKRTKDSTGPDFQAIAFELAVKAGLSLEEQKELQEKHTIVTRSGFRRLHISTPKEK
jgi:putative phage-type endonuclease